MPILTTESFLLQLPKNASEKHFLLAVSSGIDSMVLLDLFLQAGLNFQVAHVNYRLREESSDLDEKTVCEVCSRNGIPFYLHTAADKPEKGSVQLWARELRYQFFRGLLNTENLDYLVTAHHLNDQLETFMINVIRGTGIRGLTGIPHGSNDTLRPLLPFSRLEIERYAHQNEIVFREDHTNAEDYYLRNRIRNHIVPELEQITPDFLKNFALTLQNLNQTRNFVDKHIELVFSEISRVEDSSIIINKSALQQQSEFVQFEIMNRFGFRHQEEIAKMFAAEKGKIFLSANYKLTVDHAAFHLAAINHHEECVDLIIESVENSNEINLTTNDFGQTADKENKWSFHKDKLSFPLTIRKPLSGDRLFPVGFEGSKKVSKFLKDEKLPILATQKIRVLADAQNNILGVLPLRQDRRCAADTKSENVFQIIF